MLQATPSQRASAFTLIELLVVMGIISMLLTMLLPVLAAAKRSGQTVTCLSNLRQLGVAVHAYGVDHSGHYMPYGGTHALNGDGTGRDQPGPGWTEMLHGYLPLPDFTRSDAAIWNCPRFPMADVSTYFMSARWLASMQRANLRDVDLHSPSDYLMFGDCTRWDSYPPPVGRFIFFDDVDKDDAAENSFVSAAGGGIDLHGRGNAALFGDGSAAVTDPDTSQSNMSFSPIQPGIKWDDLQVP